MVFDTGPYATESTQLPIQQAPSEATCRMWQCEVQGQDTPYAQRRAVSIGTALNYGSFSSLEHGSVHSPSSTRWLVEESSVGMPSWNQPFRSLDHPSSLNSTSPAIPNVFNMNPSTIIAGIGAEFDWLASGPMVNFEAVYQSRSNVKDMMVDHGHNDLMEYNQTQRAHEGQMKREDGRPLSTLFDLPHSCTAETQASTHVVRSGSRHICGICFKAHTRPSRAIACENEHLGYQPFVCDGTCGDPGW
ncbi:hypothetical protein FRC15_010972 [Serendipita sp. 397]|nr:hypothetical protein FRC15_010972 [Serendipita sp. 397]